MPRFLLFQNRDKKKDIHPDFKGGLFDTITIKAPGAYRIALWEKLDKWNKPYFQGQISIFDPLNPHSYPDDDVTKEEAQESLRKTREALDASINKDAKDKSSSAQSH